MTENVVAELERWLELWDIGYYAVTPSLETIPLVKRARDEIVALRSSLEHNASVLTRAVVEATPVIRAEALEEAAQVCISLVGQFPQCGVAASAIRALKEP